MECLLLGKNTIQEPVAFLQAVCSRADEFTLHDREFTVGVATYNVNGGKHTRSYLDKANSLSEWLNIPEQQPPDLFAIGERQSISSYSAPFCCYVLGNRNCNRYLFYFYTQQVLPVHFSEPILPEFPVGNLLIETNHSFVQSPKLDLSPGTS